MTIQVGTEAG
jgi:hypothetical protein